MRTWTEEIPEENWDDFAEWLSEGWSEEQQDEVTMSAWDVYYIKAMEELEEEVGGRPSAEEIKARAKTIYERENSHGDQKEERNNGVNPKHTGTNG